MKKILVTGGAGYIGTVLIKNLLEKGYQVLCLDRFFFGFKPISHFINNPNFSFIKEDIREVQEKYFENIFGVIDLAAISNDPAGALDPIKTMEINYKGRVRIASIAKKMGVQRYILASSCSVYGFNENTCNENTAINPLTTYAKAGALAEKEILSLADGQFCCTAFRFATVYGISPKMRFDLVVNIMTLNLFKNKTIIVNGDGLQKRPLIDVRDVSEAYILGINAEKNLINGQIFNVGSNQQNYTMIDLATEIKKAIGKDSQIISKGDDDKRSYQIGFSKIKEKLQFEPKYTPSEASKEIYLALEKDVLDYGLETKTVEWYKKLILDANFSI